MQSPVSLAQMIAEIIQCYLTLDDIIIPVLIFRTSVLQLWVFAWIANIFIEVLFFWIVPRGELPWEDTDDFNDWFWGIHDDDDD